MVRKRWVIIFSFVAFVIGGVLNISACSKEEAAAAKTVSDTLPSSINPN